MEVELHAFLTSALGGGELSASRLGRFTHGERAPLHPLDRRLSGTQSGSGRDGEEKKNPFRVSARNQTPVVQVLKLVTILTELPKLPLVPVVCNFLLLLGLFVWILSTCWIQFFSYFEILSNMGYVLGADIAQSI
jgi:hypothetical protein